MGIYTYVKVVFANPNPNPNPNPNTYVKVVRRAADFFAVLFLMSMSNMVSNFYGGALDREVAPVTLRLPLPLAYPYP